MPETNANSPETLLAQVAMGNRAAFETLYRTTAKRLFGPQIIATTPVPGAAAPHPDS